ncbi:MAG: TIGR04255 family protein [Actinomycetia bacterium]|nr:TIGR04255 family protein [Actinomycetes bacterium]
MPLNLPEPMRDRLPRAQLDLVVCQVRHERNFASIDPKRALSVHSTLASRYPSIEDMSAQEIGFVVSGPTGVGPVSSETSRGWRFRSPDEKWIVVIMPDFFSLETTEYSTWEEFKERLTELTAAIHDQLSPSIETRLGLRYIDRLTKPHAESARDWAPFIDPSLIGPILHPTLGDSLTQLQQVVRLDTDDGRQVILRHGCSTEDGGGWTYLLDYDCSTARSQPFEAEAVLTGIEDLHTIALQVFQASVTPALMAYLREEV